MTREGYSAGPTLAGRMRHLHAPYLRVRSSRPLQQYLVNLVTPAPGRATASSAKPPDEFVLDQRDQSRAAVFSACSGLPTRRATPGGNRRRRHRRLERDGLIQTAAALRA